jgi:hypothetical protein
MRSEEHSSEGGAAIVEAGSWGGDASGLWDASISAAILGFPFAFCSHISRVFGSIGHVEGSWVGRC